MLRPAHFRASQPAALIAGMLTAALCRSARSLLQWTREQLAHEAGLSPATVTAFELESRQPTRSTVAQLTGALEAAGIVFTTDSADQLSVALRKP
jgi:transcriptional regulator with XRE-family HTH domain